MHIDKKGRQEQKDLKLNALDSRYTERYGVTYREVMDKVASGKKKHRGFPDMMQLLHYAGREKHYYIWAIVLGIIAAAVSLMVPIALQNIIDLLTASEWQQVLIWGAVYAVAFAGMYGIYWVYMLVISRASQGTAHNLRVALAEAILDTKAKKYDTVSTGDILNRINNDPAKISDNFTQVINYSTNLIEAFAFTIYAFFVNPWLALVLFGCSIIQFLTYFIYNKFFQKRNQRRNKLIHDNNTSAFNEMVRGNCDVKNLNLKHIMLKKMVGLSLNRYKSIVDTTNQRQAFIKTGSILHGLALFVFFVVAVLMLQSNAVTLGGVLVLITYRWYMLELFDNVNQVYELMQDAEVSAERVCEILNDEKYPKEHFGTLDLPEPRGEIEFKHVTFSYREDMSLFQDMSFKINAGETIGIVGKSGQGKSTIINLIPKIYDIDSGEILLDGINIADLTEDALRNTVSVVPQAPYIFNMTIRENLLFAKPDATQEEIIDACKKAQIHDFIMTKPEGYDSVVGESGIMLSGGQKQRLAIARALLKDSKVLLLDEATSALDNESQGKIKEVIHNLSGERTVVIVAHRLTTVVDCDRILVIDGNKIIADGPHEELRKSCSVYRNLYQSEE